MASWIPPDVEAAMDARVAELLEQAGPMPDSVADRLVAIIDSTATSADPAPLGAASCGEAGSADVAAEHSSSDGTTRLPRSAASTTH